MITKINYIKNFGIFKNFSWNQDLPEFKRYNLIYGWNGSGKTTLTKLFSALETGNIEEFQSAEYELETETGRIRENTPPTRKVRVFNQDYIIKNVELLSGKANPIFILGEENKKIADEIKKDEQLLLQKKIDIKNATENKNKLVKDRDKQFTDIARTISTNTSGEATRKYNKTNAEAAFKQLLTKELLEMSDIKKHSLTLRQLEKPLLEKLCIPKFIYLGTELEVDDTLVQQINSEAKQLAAQTVESIIIERLKQNSDISKWVEDGIALHERYKSKTCEYCNQPLPEDRSKQLASYFNDADKKLKDSINVLVDKLREIYSLFDGLTAIDKARLYEDMQPEYESAVQLFHDAKKDVLKKITVIGTFLKEKKSKTTEFVVLDCEVDIVPLVVAVENVNASIYKHNAKTSDFKSQKSTAQKTLEKHYLSTIYDEIKSIDAKIVTIEKTMTKLIEGDTEEIGIKILGEKIDENKAKISSSHKACDQINKGIKTFLGRDEIVFEVADSGYFIKRNGIIAKNLSEGEKTAIAFVYFTVGLADQNFNANEGIVVIDDPVSSLDSNSLFQAFAFLKNAVKDVKQVVLLTHNFDFLRLLLNWLNHVRTQKSRSLYMLKNSYASNPRTAEISKLDPLLIEHESEYHYLFKKLYQFQSDGTIESVYSIPNLARKVLETFLMFRVPNNKSRYEKLSGLSFDENKKTAIYKFVNDQSHITGKGFDPSLVPETQNNVKYLLEMMKSVFEEHYKILEESIKTS